MSIDAVGKRQKVLETLRNRNTLVLGHRGASADAPMNTLAAFKLAIEQGADGVELDVHLSKDNVPVVIHDASVDATTDGRGTVADMELGSLKSLDAGGWFGSKFTGERIPTLSEVFIALDSQTIINVEIKYEGTETNAIVEAVTQDIEQHARQTQVIVSSFNPFVLKTFREVLPEVLLGWLHIPNLIPEIDKILSPKDYDLYHPHYEAIGTDLIAESAINKPILTWTVNDVGLAQTLKQKGVLGIITDTPQVILKSLRTD